MNGAADERGGPHSGGVKKLERATILRSILRAGSRANGWEFRVGGDPADNRLSERDWSEVVDEALLEAVDRRRVADVPVGVLLSGGLDSSLIVALLSKLGHEEIRTFSIGFESVALEALPEAIWSMSEPMVSHDCVAFHLLSREVAKRVKVVQSGQETPETTEGQT
jgi:asparagine synthase (glutamine-hydrolysing)